MWDKTAFAFGRGQAIAYNFLQAKINKNITHMLFPFENRVADLWWERVSHSRFGDIVITITARNLFQYIRKPDNTFTDIQAVRGGLHFHRVLLDRAFELKPGEQFSNLFRGEIDTEQTFNIFRRNGNRRGFWLKGIRVHEPGRDLPTGPLCHKL